MNQIISKIILSMRVAGLALIISFLSISFIYAQNFSDTDISSAIERAFKDERIISSHLIDAQTRNGIVTLSGTIDHILGKERSVEVAQTIKGVRSVIDNIKVNPLDRKDSAILADIEAALTLDLAADEEDIEVSVNNGVVIVRGIIHSLSERHAVLAVAKAIRGVKSVKDELSFDYPTKRPDHEIKSDIERRFEINPLISADSLSVAVNNAKVTLSGTVSNAFQRNKAYQLAWIPGVHMVNNHKIEVDPSQSTVKQRNSNPRTIPDQEIKAAVTDTLKLDYRLYALPINVKVSDGEVTLTGKVNRLDAKNIAEQDALNTVGVSNVINKLKVRPKRLPQDFEIAQNAKRALQWSPILDRYQLNVFVKNKKVFLSGTVDTWEEKQYAQELISKLEAVVEIDNNITVFPNEWKSDKNIKEDIEAKLFWDILINSDNINVDVSEGNVTLTGTVKSWQEYRKVVVVALDAGALIVNNNLSVDEAVQKSPTQYYEKIFSRN